MSCIVMSEAERPTAVFAANDLLAIGLLQGFVTHGLRIPEDIAIIGYDDIAFAASAAVPLSSIRQPRQLLGRRAAELLFAEIEALDERPAAPARARAVRSRAGCSRIDRPGRIEPRRKRALQRRKGRSEPELTHVRLMATIPLFVNRFNRSF